MFEGMTANKSVDSHLETKGFGRLRRYACVIPMTLTAVKHIPIYIHEHICLKIKNHLCSYCCVALFPESTRKGLHHLNTTKYNPFVTWAPLCAKVIHC